MSAKYYAWLVKTPSRDGRVVCVAMSEHSANAIASAMSDDADSPYPVQMVPIHDSDEIRTSSVLTMQCFLLPGVGIHSEEYFERKVVFFEGEEEILTPVSIRESSFLSPWRLTVTGSDHDRVRENYERRKSALLEQVMIATTFVPPEG